MASGEPGRPAVLYHRGASLTLGRTADAAAVFAQALAAAHAIGDMRAGRRARVDRVFTRTEADRTAISVLDEERLARESLLALGSLGTTPASLVRG
jgi:hypothetical protein